MKKRIVDGHMTVTAAAQECTKTARSICLTMARPSTSTSRHRQSRQEKQRIPPPTTRRYGWAIQTDLQTLKISKLWQ